MPQMSPMDWLMLSYYFLLIYWLFMIMVYFMFLIKFISFNKKEVSLKNYCIYW